jgi:hypothetical protein
MGLIPLAELTGFQGLGASKSLRDMSPSERASWIDKLKREMRIPRRAKRRRTREAEERIRRTHALIARADVPVEAAPWGGGRLAWERARGLPETQERIHARERATARETGQPWTPWGPPPKVPPKISSVEDRAYRRRLLEDRIKARGLQSRAVTLEVERRAHAAAAAAAGDIRHGPSSPRAASARTTEAARKAAVRGMRASPKYQGRGTATIESREALVRSMKPVIGEKQFQIEMNRIELAKARKSSDWSKQFENWAHKRRMSPGAAHALWEKHVVSDEAWDQRPWRKGGPRAPTRPSPAAAAPARVSIPRPPVPPPVYSPPGRSYVSRGPAPQLIF